MEESTSMPINAKALIEFKKVIEADDDFKKIALDLRVPNRAVCLGTEMSPEEHVELLAFLNKNINVFARSTSDLIGVSKNIIKHRL
jgi:hypothetical protein